MNDSSDIHRLDIDGKEIVLIGTAHVSKESAELVESVIEEERPDTVCVELCNSRYEAIMDRAKWRETDIFSTIREKRSSLLLFQLLMASLQRKLADKFHIKPGEEMLRAAKKAEEIGAKLVLADRDIRVTLNRTWRKMRFLSKMKLLFEVPMALFSTEEMDVEEIEKMKQKDVLELAMSTFGKKMPDVKATLIDERDMFLAHSIRNAPGSRIVAVVGAGHVSGILRNLENEIDVASINEIPPKSNIGRVLAWGIVALVVGIIVGGFFRSGTQASLDMLKWWVMANGVLAGLGALAVMAHPITIVTSVLAAPLTSLNPMIAAGWVAGLTEASLRKPKVKDFMELRNDITSIGGFWRNKISRILLIVFFVNVGSSVGTFIAIPMMMRFL
jgi:pheromone shutdown-related protein TraB